MDALRVDAPVFDDPSARLRFADFADDDFAALFFAGMERRLVDVVVADFFALVVFLAGAAFVALVVFFPLVVFVAIAAFFAPAAFFAVVDVFAVAAGLAGARDERPCAFFAAAFFTVDDFFVAAVSRGDAAGRAVALDVAREPTVEPGFVVLVALTAPPFPTDVFFATGDVDAVLFAAPRFAGTGLPDAAVFLATGLRATVFFAGDRFPAAAFDVAGFLAAFFGAAFLAPPVLVAEAEFDFFLAGVTVVLAMHASWLRDAITATPRLEPRMRCPCEDRVSERRRDHSTFMKKASPMSRGVRALRSVLAGEKRHQAEQVGEQHDDVAEQ